MSEVEIRDELKDQGVVGVKKEGEVIPTNTLFLTFGSPDLPKEITVGYLKVKVALFVPNPMRCFNCNKCGHTSQSCNVAAKCPGCGKDKHEGRCEGPKLCSNCNGPHASSVKDCPVWQKEKEIQCVRVEKRISFPEARQLAEAKMTTVVSGGKTYAAATFTRREFKSVECQTSLTVFVVVVVFFCFCFVLFLFVCLFVCLFLFCFENVHLGRLSLTCVLLAVSTSVKSGTVSADARVPCQSAKCSSETDRRSADPFAE